MQLFGWTAGAKTQFILISPANSEPSADDPSKAFTPAAHRQCAAEVVSLI